MIISDIRWFNELFEEGKEKIKISDQASVRAIDIMRERIKKEGLPFRFETGEDGELYFCREFVNT